MTICDECAKRLGYTPKDKCVGVWVAKCDFCGKKKAVCDSVHDYCQPKEGLRGLNSDFVSVRPCKKESK